MKKGRADEFELPTPHFKKVEVDQRLASDTSSNSEEDTNIELILDQNDDLLQICHLMARTIESDIIKSQ